MEKYVTSIGDLVYDVITNGIVAGLDPSTNFQMGMVHLLGINTAVNCSKAYHYLGHQSLMNDLDANSLLGFIAEMDGNYSLAFKHYAKVAGETDNSDFSYLQNVIKGRSYLQKLLKKYSLPLTINEEITKIMSDCNKGNSSSKLNSKIIIANLCEDESMCLEVAQELYNKGEVYYSKKLLRKGNVAQSNSLYESIDNCILELKDSWKLTKPLIIELDDNSLLSDYDVTLSIPEIKNKCCEISKTCKNEWSSSIKKNVDSIVKSQIGKIEREEKREKQKKTEKLENILFIIIPILIFIASWIKTGNFIGSVGVAFLYYSIGVPIFLWMDKK